MNRTPWCPSVGECHPVRISREDLAGRLSAWPRFSREEVPWLLRLLQYSFRVDEKYRSRYTSMPLIEQIRPAALSNSGKSVARITLTPAAGTEPDPL
jgi:hypothetical protein